jgi:hypothetical protein
LDILCWLGLGSGDGADSREDASVDRTPKKQDGAGELVQGRGLGRGERRNGIGRGDDRGAEEPYTGGVYVIGELQGGTPLGRNRLSIFWTYPGHDRDKMWLARSKLIS